MPTRQRERVKGVPGLALQILERFDRVKQPRRRPELPFALPVKLVLIIRSHRNIGSGLNFKTRTTSISFPSKVGRMIPISLMRPGSKVYPRIFALPLLIYQGIVAWLRLAWQCASVCDEEPAGLPLTERGKDSARGKKTSVPEVRR
jgi:hypothetical protein